MDGVDADGWSDEQLEAYIAEHHVACPQCGKSDFTSIRKFNMMFKTFQGVTEDSQQRNLSASRNRTGHLRQLPECRPHHAPRACPSASHRSANPSATRSLPATSPSAPASLSRWSWSSSASPAKDLEWFEYWRGYCRDWLLSLGMTEDHLRLRDHAKEELAFYSKATTDFEYLFPFGWGELWGVADRTDYDLKQHQEHSGQPMEYIDPVTNERAICPTSLSPSLGADRAALAFLADAYEENKPHRRQRAIRHPHRAASAPGAGALQGCRTALAEEQAGRGRDRAL